MPLLGTKPAYCWRASWSRASNRSEEHTSELQSPMRISYAVFCLNNKLPPSTTNTICTSYNLFIFDFLFIDTATTEIYTYVHPLPRHDALPICHSGPSGTSCAMGSIIASVSWFML